MTQIELCSRSNTKGKKDFILASLKLHNPKATQLDHLALNGATAFSKLIQKNKINKFSLLLDNKTYLAKIADVQRDPLTFKIIHLDFIQL